MKVIAGGEHEFEQQRAISQSGYSVVIIHRSNVLTVRRYMALVSNQEVRCFTLLTAPTQLSISQCTKPVHIPKYQQNGISSPEVRRCQPAIRLTHSLSLLSVSKKCHVASPSRGSRRTHSAARSPAPKPKIPK